MYDLLWLITPIAVTALVSSVFYRRHQRREDPLTHLAKQERARDAMRRF